MTGHSMPAVAGGGGEDGEEGQETTQTRRARMKRVQRDSVADEFEVSANDPIPPVPIGGARIRVLYAGACYTEKQVQKTGKRRPRIGGIHDTSLFPGYEISGTIDAVCNTVEENKYKVGERVIVYPEEDEESEADTGYAEYVVVKDVGNLIKIMDSLSMQIAAMLPTGGLLAYNTITRIRPFVEDKVKRKDSTHILIVGAGGLGLWIVRLARSLLCSGTNGNKVNITVADANIEKLIVAQDHGCTHVLHWNDQLHEEYLLERTRNVCTGGVDILIDIVSNPRTIQRALKVLSPEGVLVVGGNAHHEVSFCLHSLAQSQLTIMGVSKGSKDQLLELVEAVARGEVKPPIYNIFPVDEANQVFEQLNKCKIAGRAILQVSLDEPEVE